MLSSAYRPADADIALEQVTIGDLLRRVAVECPNRVALIDGQVDPASRRRWSYAELWAAAERYAHALRRLTRPGERIVLYAGNSAEWMILFYAVSLSGCVLVPANPAYTADELAHIVVSSDAAVVVHAERHRGRALAPVVEAVRSRSPVLRHVLAMTDLERWPKGQTGGPHQAELPSDPRAVALIQYTSGTTGSPKGACLHHLGIINSTRFVGERAGLPDGDVWIAPMPLFHIGASVTSGLGSLTRRGTLIVMPEYDPVAMLQLIADERANTSLLVPTMIVALLEAKARGAFDLSSFRMLFSGATTVPEALVKRIGRELDCSFSILFGQTELSGNVSATHPADLADDQSETVGTPLPGVEARIVDRATGALLPVGAAGEICFRGYQVMQGYLDRPDETAKVLDADGWLRTGDIGTMDARGYMRVSGRIKDVVIRGGMNVYPREIEDVLLEHPGIGDACVIGLADDRLGEVVGAVVRRTGDEMIGTEDLHRYCRARLAAYKTPSRWFFADTLPRTPTGKIQKYLVLEQIAAGALVASPPIPTSPAATGV